MKTGGGREGGSEGGIGFSKMKSLAYIMSRERNIESFREITFFLLLKTPLLTIHFYTGRKQVQSNKAKCGKALLLPLNYLLVEDGVWSGIQFLKKIKNFLKS